MCYCEGQRSVESRVETVLETERPYKNLNLVTYLQDSGNNQYIDVINNTLWIHVKANKSKR